MFSSPTKQIGILALQGNFAQHASILKQLHLQPVLVREANEIASLDGLILPGGESTTMCHLITPELREAIIKFAAIGKPILGTCAGLILLASAVKDCEKFVEPLCLLNIEVQRNAYGSQIHSAFKEIKLQSDQQLLACFIRAPGITKIVGENVQILATTSCGNPCAVRQTNIFGLAFHPEINGILDLHRMAFLIDFP